ncbi:hypothetical protein D3C85_1843010 [compost metagenome]
MQWLAFEALGGIRKYTLQQAAVIGAVGAFAGPVVPEAFREQVEITPAYRAHGIARVLALEWR